MAYQIAQVHASRREPDAAFEWLDRAYTQGDPGLSYMKPEPLFRPLHGDPRRTRSWKGWGWRTECFPAAALRRPWRRVPHENRSRARPLFQINVAG
jgi:hypothetical protein